MTIVQIDAPLHHFELTEYEGQYTGRRYAVGVIGFTGVGIHPTTALGQWSADLYVTGGIHTFVGTYEEAEALVRAAAYYHDPRVAFTIAAAGPCGLEEVAAA